jgi:hypothetical protein
MSVQGFPKFDSPLTPSVLTTYIQRRESDFGSRPTVLNSGWRPMKSPTTTN